MRLPTCSDDSVYAHRYFFDFAPTNEQDCDMPEGLQTPSERPEGGVDDVDVMGMLGLKRADSLSAPKKEDEEDLTP